MGRIHNTGEDRGDDEHPVVVIGEMVSAIGLVACLVYIVFLKSSLVGPVM